MRLTILLSMTLALVGCADGPGFLGRTADRIADRAIEAETYPERRTRVAAFAAVVSIIIDARVRQSDPQAAFAVAPRLERLDTAVAKVLADETGIWNNLALAEGRFALYAVVEQRVGDLVASQVWHNPFSVLDLNALGIAAAQIAFADAALTDIQEARAAVRAGTLTEANLRMQLRAEFSRRRASVEKFVQAL